MAPPRSWPSTANSCSALRSIIAADTASASAAASRRPHPATARPAQASGRAAIRAVRAVEPRGSPLRGVSPPGLSSRGASTYAPTIVSVSPDGTRPSRSYTHDRGRAGVRRPLSPARPGSVVGDGRVARAVPTAYAGGHQQPDVDDDEARQGGDDERVGARSALVEPV